MSQDLCGSPPSAFWLSNSGWCPNVCKCCCGSLSHSSITRLAEGKENFSLPPVFFFNQEKVLSRFPKTNFIFISVATVMSPDYTWASHLQKGKGCLLWALLHQHSFQELGRGPLSPSAWSLNSWTEARL